MRYLGSKRNIAKKIKHEIVARKGNRTHYLEPFVGGGNSFCVIAPEFETASASDIHTDLILMWQELQNGWEPPSDISEEDYKRIINATEPSALRGIVGFGASFGGKWKGGFAKPSTKGHSAIYYANGGTDYHMTLRSVDRQIRLTPHAIFTTASYTEVNGDTNTVIYCDPPYASTTKYRNADRFNSTAFWEWCSHQATSNDALMFVSEYSAPDNWKCVQQFSHNSSVNVKTNSSPRTEKLFMHISQVDPPV